MAGLICVSVHLYLAKSGLRTFIRCSGIQKCLEVGADGRINSGNDQDTTDIKWVGFRPVIQSLRDSINCTADVDQHSG